MDSDPPVNNQICLPIIIFKQILNQYSQGKFKYVSQVILGALFFALRSCEYVSPLDSTPRKTQLIQYGHIRFFMEGKEILEPTSWSMSHSVSLTFITQKNNMPYTTITQCRSGSNLCPVKAWAVIKSRLHSYPNTNHKTPINTVKTGNQYHRITASQVRDLLKQVTSLPENINLGLNPSRVGTHSIRCSAAMLMHSAKINADIIKLVGRWKSDSYTKYFRTEVQSFTSGVSNKMVSSENTFFLIPTPDANQKHRRNQQQDKLWASILCKNQTK